MVSVCDSAEKDFWPTKYIRLHHLTGLTDNRELYRDVIKAEDYIVLGVCSSQYELFLLKADAWM